MYVDKMAAFVLSAFTLKSRIRFWDLFSVHTGNSVMIFLSDAKEAPPHFYSLQLDKCRNNWSSIGVKFLLVQVDARVLNKLNSKF